MVIPVVQGSIQSECQFIQGFETSSFQSQGADLLPPRFDEVQPACVLGRELDLDLGPSRQGQARLTADMRAQVVFNDQPPICREVDDHSL